MSEDQTIPIQKVPQNNQINPNLDIPHEVRATLENDVQKLVQFLLRKVQLKKINSLPKLLIYQVKDIFILKTIL